MPAHRNPPSSAIATPRLIAQCLSLCYNASMRMRVDKIIYTGKSLGRVEGKVVMADEGIPGETIEVSPVRSKKNYVEAKTDAVIEAAPGRIRPRCGHYRTCSPYQYMEYGLQLKIKSGQAEEALSHHLKIRHEGITIRPSPQVWHYRNRARFRLVYSTTGLTPAYHDQGPGNRLTEIDECFLVSQGLTALLKDLMTILTERKIGYAREVTVRENSDRTEQLMFLRGDEPLAYAEGMFRELTEKHPLAGLVYAAGSGEGHAVTKGMGHITETAAGKTFLLGAESFFQVNTPALELMIRDIEDVLAGRRIGHMADLYAGTGLFSIVFSSMAGRVTGIELERENTAYFRKNAEINKAGNVSVREGDCYTRPDKFVPEKADVVFVDPPRRGIGPGMCKALLSRRPGMILYVSCELSTLVRDLQSLLGQYGLRQFFVYDFFPHTTHMEALAVLERL